MHFFGIMCSCILFLIVGMTLHSVVVMYVHVYFGGELVKLTFVEKKCFVS